tara:strand:+ start:4379 stop:4855 length:477 start_codon:yes stop_codon:yes gene_type:complete
MTWTYGGDPSASALAAIRFLTGDTDTNDQLINDEEIAWTNNQVTGSDTATTALYEVAYRVMIAIASKFSRLADQSVGDLKVDMFQKATNAREQAALLKQQALREGNTPTPYAGGISVSDKEIDEENSDIVQPYFSRGQFTNKRGGANEVVADYGAGAN